VTERRALTYVEVDIPVCSLTYGVAPCTAAVPTTGPDKCLNTKATCQDRAHYAEAIVTLRFAKPAGYLPADIDCIACIIDVEHTPGRVSLGEDLGERASIKVTLQDHPHSDAGAGFDKYFATRAYDPYKQGTLFGKFRARQPFLRGAAVRWKQGFLGDALADFETRSFTLDFTDGPSADGVFSITAKDVLKLLDADRAQAPVTSKGFLQNDITETDTAITLLPSGVGTSDYTPSGYVNLGGNEIVSYSLDPTAGNDADTILLLHMEGTDGVINTTTNLVIDSSASNRTASLISTPEFEIDWKKFGNSSTRWIGEDGITFPDSPDWNLSSDKTFDFWEWVSGLAASRAFFSHQSSPTLGYRLTAETNGSIKFVVENTSNLLTLQSAAGLLVVATTQYFHIAVEKFGTLWTLFFNGAIVAQTTATVTAPDPSAPFRVGAVNNTSSGTPNGMTGSLDEFRVSKVARYHGAAFTPPSSPYLAPDSMAIIRGQLGTVASSHQEQDRVQQVLVYDGQDPADIIRDLEVNYAGVPPSYIDLSAWQVETDAFLAQAYSAIIPEPTPVKTLVAEIIEQAGLAHWQDDAAAALRLLVIREVGSDAATFDATKRLMGSLEIVEQPAKRVSRVEVYYGLIDPTRGLNDADNFRSVEVTIDEEAEADYGNSVIKKIFSRWIPEFGGAVAAVTALNFLARYRDAPRKLSFDAMRGGVVPVLGGGYKVASAFLQNAFGAPEIVPVQVTRLIAGPASLHVEAEEMRFASALSSDPNHHIIIIAANTTGFNLRSRHDDLYGTPVAGNLVTCIINSGVVVGATGSTVPAFDTGDWPAGVTIVVEINGTIQGAGGDGGKGTKVTSNSGGVTSRTLAKAGLAGGTAYKARYAHSIDGTGFVKGGGGGGGGGGAFAVASETKFGGAGGGGAGRIVGQGATVWDSHQTEGDDGTLTAGGLGKNGSSGGDGGKGGNGGGPAVAGQDGVTVGGGGFLERVGGLGGAAGKAVEGNSFVTTIGTVTFTGARV